MTAATATMPHSSVERRTLWFPLLSGPVLWSLAVVVGYPVAAQSCAPGLFPLPRPIIGSGVRWIDGLWVLVSIGIQVVAVITAAKSWRTARAEEAPDDQVGIRVRFMALAGLISSLLFLDALILTGLGVILARPCSG